MGFSFFRRVALIFESKFLQRNLISTYFHLMRIPFHFISRSTIAKVTAFQFSGYLIGCLLNLASFLLTTSCISY